jgi:hypothetical protein
MSSSMQRYLPCSYSEPDHRGHYQPDCELWPGSFKLSRYVPHCRTTAAEGKLWYWLYLCWDRGSEIRSHAGVVSRGTKNSSNHFLRWQLYPLPTSPTCAASIMLLGSANQRNMKSTSRKPGRSRVCGSRTLPVLCPLGGVYILVRPIWPPVPSMEGTASGQALP